MHFLLMLAECHYLKIGEASLKQRWYESNGCANSQHKLKLVDGESKVAVKAQTPQFDDSLQVKEYCVHDLSVKGNLILSTVKYNVNNVTT